jgi:hypothetical protein
LKKPSLLFYSIILGITAHCFGQSATEKFLTPSDTLNKVRRNSAMIAETAVAACTYVALDKLWYADYPHSNFHFVNDNSEWFQMDKAGHLYSAYHISNFSSDIFAWSGMSQNNRVIFGAATGFVLLSAVEIFDGYSEEWGASKGDLLANAGGTVLWAGQELLWKEQRIVPKFSFHTTPYASARPNVLGESLAQQIIKDYNGQTYWLSVNLYSFFKGSKMPRWLNLAAGYGGEGMITAKDGNPVNGVFFPEKKPIRQFYFSLDADLTKIQTHSHLLKTIFSAVNTIKIPAPALEFNGRGVVKFHSLYF